MNIQSAVPALVANGGVCDPDALTANAVDKMIAKHASTLHTLLHNRSE